MLCGQALLIAAWFYPILAFNEPRVTLDAPDPEALAPHVQVARTKTVMAARRARLVLQIRIRLSQAGELIVVFATPVSSGLILQAPANSHAGDVRLDITRMTEIRSARVAAVIMIVMQ